MDIFIYTEIYTANLKILIDKLNNVTRNNNNVIE